MRLTLHRLLLLLLLSMALGAQGQATLATEGFGSDGEGTRYTTNTTTIYAQLAPSATHYFMRATDNAVKCPNSTGSIVFGLTASPGYIYSSGTTVAPAGFWASEGGRSTGSANTADAGTVTLNAVPVTGYNDLKVSLKLADARGAGYVFGPTSTSGTPGTSAQSPQAEIDDKIRIEYSMNGGTWTTVGLFTGDNATGSGNWRAANTSTEQFIPGAPC